MCVRASERCVTAMRDLPLSKTRSGDNLIIKDLFFSLLLSPLTPPTPLLSSSLLYQLADNARNVTRCHHLVCVSVCVFCGFADYCSAVSSLLYWGIESVKLCLSVLPFCIVLHYQCSSYGNMTVSVLWLLVFRHGVQKECCQKN